MEKKRYTDEGFKESLRKVQTQELGLIPEGVELEKYTRLRRLLRRWSKTEVIKNGLDSSVIEAKNCWRKRERGRGV